MIECGRAGGEYVGFLPHLPAHLRALAKVVQRILVYFLAFYEVGDTCYIFHRIQLDSQDRLHTNFFVVEMQLMQIP